MDNRQRGIGSIPVKGFKDGGEPERDEYGRTAQQKQLDNLYRQLEAMDAFNTAGATREGAEAPWLMNPENRMMAVGVRDDLTGAGPGVILYDPSRGESRTVSSGSLGSMFEQGDPTAAYEQAKNALPYFQTAASLGISGPTTQAQERQIVDTLERQGVPALSFMEYGKGTFASPDYGVDPNVARRREEDAQRGGRVKPFEFFNQYLRLTPYLGGLPSIPTLDQFSNPPVQRFFTGGAVDPAATVRESYANAQNLYNMASQRFGADDPRAQSALANMKASQAQMDETLAALAKPSYTQPATPPPAPITPPAPATPPTPTYAQPTPTYAQPTPTPEPGGIYPAVFLPYIDPRTGAVTQVDARGTPPAGMIDATNPNIYGGQQNEFIGERGLFAKGSAADLRPIMNTVLAGQNPGVGAVTVDQNIGDVRLAGKSTDYNYSQAGNQLRVFDKNNNLVSNIAVQGDQDGTKLTFDDGSTFAKGVKNAAGSYEGGLQVGGVAAGAFKGLPPPPGGGTPTVVGGGGNDGIPKPIPPEGGVPDDPLPDPRPLPPPIPPYEEGKPDPRIVLGDIASRNVVDTRIPRADTVFANSPVERVFDPVSQTFRYPSSPTKVTPASGEFMSQFIPGNVTLRRPQLLNVTRGDVPSYDQKTGTYTAPALSKSQYNARMNELSLNAMNKVLSGKKYTTSEYYELLSVIRSGAFGDPTDPNFEKNMREAVDRYVAARAAAAPPPAPKTETITGGTGNDTITGGTRNDMIYD